jgi:tol-pal system protein YbgF
MHTIGRYAKSTLTGIVFLGAWVISAGAFADVPVIDATAQDGINAADLASPPMSGPSGNQNAAEGAEINERPTGSNVEQRITQLEKRFTPRTGMDMLARIDQLQQQIQELRGQNEMQSHQIQQLETALRVHAQDHEQRLAKLQSSMATIGTEANLQVSTPSTINDTGKKPFTSNLAQLSAATANAKITGSSKGNLANTSNSGDSVITISSGNSDKAGLLTTTSGRAALTETGIDLMKAQKSYQEAYNLLRARKYDAAKTGFQSLISEFPSGGYAANSHYWLGEIFLLQNNLDQAAAEFGNVLTNNPTHVKTAEAMLKLGYVYSEKKQWAKARYSLKKVIELYPGTSASQLANAKLQEIKA